MPRKSCCTGLAYRKESGSLYVANSQDDGGIYIVNTALENEEPTCMKLVANSTATCSRAYSLTISRSGVVYFTDVDARKTSRLSSDGTVETVVGSGNEEPSDGCQKTTTFVQPTGLCAEGNSLYVVDTGAGAQKLVSPTAPIANFLQQ